MKRHKRQTAFFSCRVRDHDFARHSPAASSQRERERETQRSLLTHMVSDFGCSKSCLLCESVHANFLSLLRKKLVDSNDLLLFRGHGGDGIGCRSSLGVEGCPFYKISGGRVAYGICSISQYYPNCHLCCCHRCVVRRRVCAVR